MFSYRDRFVTGVIGLVALALLALTTAPASAGDSIVVPDLFAGTHSSDGNVVIVVKDTGSGVLATFLAEDIPLSAPCNGQLADLFIPDIAVNVPDESFNKTIANGGAGGQFLENANPFAPPYIAGTAFVHLPGPEFECINSIQYEVDLEVLQLGDVNCSWENGFQAFGLAGSGDPPAPDADGVDAVDALNILRKTVFLPVPDNPPDCPDMGTETPSGVVVGDTECDGDIDAVDALRILRHVVQLPVATPSPPCPPRMGIFYDPG